jgi:hypothetical protein
MYPGEMLSFLTICVVHVTKIANEALVLFICLFGKPFVEVCHGPVPFYC